MLHHDIISCWPSLSEFAADIGVQYTTARAIRRRGAIPARYWPAVINHAVRRGFKGITYEILAEGYVQAASKRKQVEFA